MQSRRLGPGCWNRPSAMRSPSQSQQQHHHSSHLLSSSHREGTTNPRQANTWLCLIMPAANCSCPLPFRSTSVALLQASTRPSEPPSATLFLSDSLLQKGLDYLLQCAVIEKQNHRMEREIRGARSHNLAGSRTARARMDGRGY